MPPSLADELLNLSVLSVNLSVFDLKAMPKLKYFYYFGEMDL